MADTGLLFVASKIKNPSKLPDKVYNRFYDEEHIPDLQQFFKQKGGIAKPLALRYKNVRRDTERPYLALYPIPDAQWIFSPDQAEFQRQTKKSSILGVNDIWEHVDFSFRPYRQIQTFEGYKHASKSGVERGKTLIVVAMEPAADQEQDFEEWYRKQHLDMLSMCRGYRRSTRYKRMDDQKPRYLALHEYDCEPQDLPAEQIAQVTATEWTQKILKESPIFERDVFVLIGAFGEVAAKL